jgi:hypothetical protein
MKNKTYHTVGTAVQSNLKVVERGKVDPATFNEIYVSTGASEAEH